MDVRNDLTLSPTETSSQFHFVDHHGSVSPRGLKRKATSPVAQHESQLGRKPRACQECKRLKMRCEVPPNQTRCTRCLKRGLDCAPKLVNRTCSSSNFEVDDKLNVMREEIQSLKESFQEVLQTVRQRAQILTVAESQQTSPSVLSDMMASARSTRESRVMAMTRENSPEPVTRGPQAQNSLLVTEPMGSLYEVTRLRNIRSNQAKVGRSLEEGDQELDDFITRGIISESEAEELFEKFQTSLNHYLWVGLEEIHTSLTSIRKSSQLLASTILTVTTLHMPTCADTFDKCYDEFLSLVSSSMFSRYHSVDDVRGLCIAAFWLSDVSWKLSGHCIRIATELNIHQSFFKALEGDKEHFLRARLWYMLYVMDHHFSVAYGRPSMISESLQIREHELILQHPLANSIDYRILSQVSLFQILTRVHDCFAERRLPHHEPGRGLGLLSEDNFPQMRTFNLEIDQWRILWHGRQQTNKYIGTFPPKGIVLYSYFAKLLLNSFAVRGISIGNGSLSTERKEFANMAISAAASSLTFILEEEDLRRALVGTPLYVHTMIAFACVFLMKVATKWNAVELNVEPTFAWGLVGRMINLLESTVTSERHLAHHIAAGLSKMLARSKDGGDPQSQPPMPSTSNAMWAAPASSFTQTRRPNGVAEMSSSLAANISTAPEMPWNPYGPGMTGAANGGVDFNEMMAMNNNLIYEAFGYEPVNDVYNLLTSQFSY